jgi:hypothetical protein
MSSFLSPIQIHDQTQQFGSAPGPIRGCAGQCAGRNDLSELVE